MIRVTGSEVEAYHDGVLVRLIECDTPDAAQKMGEEMTNARLFDGIIDGVEYRQMPEADR